MAVCTKQIKRVLSFYSSEKVISQAENCGVLKWTDLRCQCIEFACKRYYNRAVKCELARANHIHEFDARELVTSASERLKVEHWPGHSLDGTMLRFHDVVKVFDLAHENWHAPAGIDHVSGSHIRSDLVYCDLFGIVIHT